MYPDSGSGPGQTAQQQHQQQSHHPQHQSLPPPPQPSVSSSQPQQPPRPWEQAYPPPNGTYPGRQDPQIRSDRPEMASIQPQYYQQPGPYLPAPAGLYPPPHEQYHRPPPPPSASNVGQSAPRQRTAIACKYCRRRKIRCSGFENSEDGRCSNCIRFSQECVFTPVSAQTQAFVPAQALYGRGPRGGPAGPPQQLYGPYGNRLPPHHDQYPPPPPASHGQPGYTLPSPTGAYPPQPHQQYPYPPGPPNPYDPAHGGRRRGPNDPPAHSHASPNHGGPPHLMTHREDGHPGYAYPDPSGYTGGPPSASSPASSNASYPSHPQPYYAQQTEQRRTSPGSASQYSYDQSRNSHSPHGAPYSYGGTPAGHPAMHGPSGQPTAAGNGRTPPPLSANERSRGGMSIHDIVSDGSNGGGERSAADSSMVSALNRPAKR